MECGSQGTAAIEQLPHKTVPPPCWLRAPLFLFSGGLASIFTFLSAYDLDSARSGQGDKGMEWSAAAGQMLTIVIMAVALGMDAFSLGIGIGLKGVRKLDVLKISSLIALFHILMPLGGMVTGHYVSTLLGDVATAAAGGLLLLLGGHMIYSALRGESVASFNHRTLWGMTVFALSVSIDAFSVGVSLGMFSAHLVMTVLMFGLVGGAMSVLGLMLGRRVSQSLGGYGEAFGGVILFAFGILFLI